MPYSYVQYAGSGTTGPFSVTFPYLLREHVKLYRGLDLLAGTYTQLLVDGTHYTWTSATQVQLTSALVSGTTLTIRRETPTNSRLVDWSDGSNLNAADMDTADLQNFYAIQDQQDKNEIVTAAGITTAANATAALNTVNAALPYAAIGAVAGIPAAPADGARIEIANSTGIESFSPLTNMPAGFVGSSQIRVRLVYSAAGSSWQWVDYAVADPDGRYVRQSNISSSVSSTSTTTVAASAAVKTAKDAADAAQSTANTANTAAAAAQSTADSASSAATAAQSTANSASSAATAAQSTADGRARMQLATAQESTSGNAIDFTDIPSWAKKITVMFAGVSTSGGSAVQIQLGAGSFDTSGYLGAGHHLTSTATAGGANSSGFRTDGFAGSNNTRHGAMVFTNISDNTWVMQGSLSTSDVAATSVASGSKTLSGTLDRIRITTVAGNQAFDAGTINLLYEG